MTTHTLHRSILRECDIRGVVAETLNNSDAYAIGKAFGTMIKRKSGKTVCVGFDGRLSSPDMTHAVVDGLVSTGLAVIRIGMGPTPMLYFAANVLNTHGGIMVTGSHNPADYNGFKMVMNNQPFFGEDIQKLARICAEGDYEEGKGFAIWCTLMEEYINRIADDFDGLRGLKVAWDAANGATGPFIHGVTRLIDGEHIILNAKVDGTFPNHHPDPTAPECLQQLKDVVLTEKCDLGIVFNGDGDRLGVIDNKGEVLRADQLMIILSQDLLSNHPGAKIIADVESSNVLFEQIETMGGEPVMWRTGHSLIKKKLKECGALLAGEMSGHIYFNDRYYGFDDALYTAVRLLGILGRTKQSLAEKRELYPAVVNTPELRFTCEEDKKFKVIEEVKKRLLGKGLDINDIDGVRASYPNGWWLLRASNSEDVLIARCEASDQINLDIIKKELLMELSRSGVVNELHHAA